MGRRYRSCCSEIVVAADRIRELATERHRLLIAAGISFDTEESVFEAPAYRVRVNLFLDDVAKGDSSGAHARAMQVRMQTDSGFLCPGAVLDRRRPDFALPPADQFELWPEQRKPEEVHPTKPRVGGHACGQEGAAGGRRKRQSSAVRRRGESAVEGRIVGLHNASASQLRSTCPRTRNATERG